MSKEIMTRFYTAFQELDAKTMGDLYHFESIFNDPAFVNLNQKEVKAMWTMLIERSNGDLKIDFHSMAGDKNMCQCTWEAVYTFSKTGNTVHNIIHATMEFQDGLIIRHTDQFDFWRWSRMALGTTGLLLGWTPIIKKKVQKIARKSLDDYMKKG
ncbi:MAG: nuclear transport factor 2 family protein [Ekhidna sp.]